MSPQSLAKILFPLAGASATQPRSKIRSPFSPLVGWLATLWPPQRRKKAKKDRSLVPEPPHITSPITFHEPKTPPIIYSTDGITSRDDDNGDDEYDASELPGTLSPSFEQGLTKEELDYVVNALLEYLEEAKVASPESSHEEYEDYAPVHNRRRLRHGLWCAPFLRSLVPFDAHLRA